MGGWQFDFSGLNPLIQGLTSRQFSAWDAQRDRQSVLESQADQAYREWLKNNAQKRSIAMGQADMERRGFDATQALQSRMEKRGVMAAEEAGPAGQQRQYQRLRNMSSIGMRSPWAQPMADQAARMMVWGGAKPLTYG